MKDSEDINALLSETTCEHWVTSEKRYIFVFDVT